MSREGRKRQVWLARVSVRDGMHREEASNIHLKISKTPKEQTLNAVISCQRPVRAALDSHTRPWATWSSRTSVQLHTMQGSAPLVSAPPFFFYPMKDVPTGA